MPEIKVSNKTDVMIDCQLATGSESPQLGQNNHYQLFVINSELLIFKDSFSMIACQLATRSETPHIGQNNHYQLFVINSKYSFSKNQNIHYQFLIVNFQRFIFYD